MKERQPDASRPFGSPSGQRESVDKSLNYNLNFPFEEENLVGREAAGGLSRGPPQAADVRAARASPPGAYGVTEQHCSSHLMDGGTLFHFGLGDAYSRRSYPLSDTTTTGAAYGSAPRSSITSCTGTTAPIYSDGKRFREGFAVCQGGSVGRTSGMQTFRPAPRYGPRHDVQRSGSCKPSLLNDDPPPGGSLYTDTETGIGCKSTFLTEAAACNSRLSDSPETRKTSQTEPSMFVAGETEPWDYNIWREDRSPSCCSTNTIYANTSDPGAPQATYENVFECLEREGSTPPLLSPGWHDEPIYATLGEQPEDEGVTDFMHEESSPRVLLKPSQVASRKTEDDAADSSGTSSADEFSPSASTLTLRPGNEGKASGSGDHKAEEQDAVKSLQKETTRRIHAPDTPPPALPPKLLKKKPPGLKLHIPEAVPATEDYGLQVRLPLERDESFSPFSSGMPTVPLRHEGEATKQGHPPVCRQGSLYVVVGSSSPGEPLHLPH